MGTNRREFLRNMGLGIGSLGVFGLSAQEAQAKIKKKIKGVKHLSAAEVARERGIEVVIDGAHAFGHFEFKQEDLDCDIYGANLHKWMMAPIGTGFLYVKKEKIKKIWPLFPAADPQGDDIRKFEHIGTHPDWLELTVGDALAFHHGIGG